MEKPIRSIGDLQALKRRRARRGISNVVLDLAPNDAFVRECEKKINRDLHACGCDVGAIFVFAALLVTAVRVASASQRPTVPGTIGLIFGFALVGKVIGILFAELRLRATIDRMTTKAAALPPHS